MRYASLQGEKRATVKKKETKTKRQQQQKSKQEYKQQTFL